MTSQSFISCVNLFRKSTLVFFPVQPIRYSGRYKILWLSVTKKKWVANSSSRHQLEQIRYICQLKSQLSLGTRESEEKHFCFQHFSGEADALQLLHDRPTVFSPRRRWISLSDRNVSWIDHFKFESSLPGTLKKKMMMRRRTIAAALTFHGETSSFDH